MIDSGYIPQVISKEAKTFNLDPVKANSNYDQVIL